MTIQISDVTTVKTTNVKYDSTDTGIFDVLMESVNLQINKQYAEGRITGTDYATVYLGALQSVLQQSLKFALEKGIAEAQIDLTKEKLKTEAANTVDATGGAAKDKADLMKAQALGFANNTKQAVLKQMIDGYSANLAIAGTANVPEATRDGAIDQLTQNILDSLTVGNDPTRVVVQSVPETADVDTGA